MQKLPSSNTTYIKDFHMGLFEQTIEVTSVIPQE